MLQKIKQSAAFISAKINFTPQIGIILGTGLGNLGKDIQVETEIEYKDIPHFPVSTVEGHHGKLLLGTLGGKKVVAMQGRFHYYEGYTMQEVTFPVRVMKLLGIQSLIVSNASGGVNPIYKVGDLMIINDQISFFTINPLIGKNIDELGPRFPDMSEPYKKSYIDLALNIARKNNITNIHTGVYAGVTGPTFETPAEYLLIQKCGADAVGMSTVAEVIVARHMGIPVFGISVITDSGAPGQIVEVSHEDVQAAAKVAGPKVSLLVKELVAAM